MNMCAPEDLNSVLQVFSPVLKSIDCRTIAVKLSPTDEKWSNLVTLVYFSDRTPEEIIIEHDSCPKIRTNQFAIFCEVSPFDPETVNEMIDSQKEEMVFSKIRAVGEMRTIKEEKVLVRSLTSSTLKVRTDQRWIRDTLKTILVSEANDPRQDRANLWAIVQKQDFEAKRSGFPQMGSLISEVLYLSNVAFNDSRDFIFIISTGIHIIEASFDKDSFRARLSPISTLRGLQLNFTLERTASYGYYRPIWRTISEVKNCSENIKPEVSIKTPAISPFDKMSVELIHREIPLTIDTFDLTAPLENTIEPFLKTLNEFCSFDDFKKMLFEPLEFGKQPQKIFEYAVNWLFSLAGFYTANLSLEIEFASGKRRKFDSLVSKGSGIPVGSADIIAYDDSERLLLIDCDTGTSFDSKLKMLVKGRNYLEKTVRPLVPIVPVLCTPNEYPNQSESGVVIFDKGILENMLIEVAKGNKKAARKKIDGIVNRIGINQL